MPKQAPFFRSLIAILATSSLVYGCGGGGGSSSNPQPSVSGKVVDGYMKNAQVFLDLNNNGVFDLGEPNGLTGGRGEFSVQASQEQINSASLIVRIISGQTVDMDQPNQTVNRDFTLTTPIGQSSVISPLTTLVAAKMANGATMAQAINELKTQLGATNLDVLADYVALKSSDNNYAQLHNVAAAIGVSLQNAQYTSGTAGFSAILANANGRISTEIQPKLVEIKSAADPVTAGGLVSSTNTPSQGSSSNTTTGSTCRGVCVNVGAIK